MKPVNHPRKKSIRSRLARAYGGIILFLFLIIALFNILIINQLKISGIDQNIQNSINSVFVSTDNLIKKSVKDHLIVENKKNIDLAEEYIKLYNEGVFTRRETKDRIKSYISSEKLGQSGYSFAVDEDGIMVAHPFDKFVDQDYSQNDSIIKLMNMKEGYLEYSWKNPGEEHLREKMLYISQLHTLDWIVATTAYSDDIYIANIRIDDVENYIDNKKIEGLSCISLLDGNGEVISNSQDAEVSEEFTCLIDYVKENIASLKREESGRLVFSLDPKRPVKSRVVSYYSYNPALDWILVGSGFYTELYSVIINSYATILITFISVFLLFIYLNRRISLQLTMPLESIVETLDKSFDDNLTRRLHIPTGDEFEAVGNHFNNFMDVQQKYIEKITRAKNEISVLAKFTDETPNPVLRINEENIIEYANQTGIELILEPLSLKTGSRAPDELVSEKSSKKSMSGRHEVEIGDRVFSVYRSKITDPAGLYIYAIDITKQKKFESIQLLSDNIFRNSIEGIVITDPDGTIESVNPAFTVITGYEAEEAIGKNPNILKSFRHEAGFYQDMWDQLKTKGYWSGEIWNRKKNGTIYPELLTITSVKDNDGNTIQYISFFHDLSDVKEKEKLILFESTHDKLTGLPNREYLSGISEKIIRFAEKENEGFSVLYFDIVNFKRINESLGVEAGDKLLVEISERLLEIFKSPNEIIRAGSDEFICIVKYKTDREDIESLINDIKGIFSPLFYISGHEVSIEISVGISVFPYDDTNLFELISKAETAMRASKASLANAYTFYSPSFKKEGLSIIEIESGLKKALEEKTFYLNYQAKVSSSTEKITGSEALVRLFPINDQFIGPDVFIPIAEQMGLIEALGTWVFEQACIDTKTLIDQGFTDIQTAVNLSPWQFRNAELPNTIRNIIEATNVPPRNINLEITESMAIDNVDESIKLMKRLTDTGISLSIDDFGTGYSSLSYLSKFPISTLKIDKSFTDGIPDDPKKTGIVNAILSLSENLGMQTVAEGVETEEQLNFLREKNCAYIQGYYFYKPLQFSDFETELKKNLA